MSITHSTSTIMNATRKPNTEFSPTNDGRVAASGFLLLAHGYEFNLGSPGITVTCDTGIWVIKTATDCFVRCGNNANGDVQNENWYNTAGTPQGDPGAYPSTGTTVFTLNTVPDTINLFTAESTTDGSPSFFEIGSFTDDDKSTFFNPTQDVKYGKGVSCVDTSGPPPATGARGDVDLQITFRKSGLDDYTITFTAESRARSEWEP